MLVQVQIYLQRLASPLGWVEHVCHEQRIVDSELPSLTTLMHFSSSISPYLHEIWLTG
jgi:hypothetical protein